MRTLVCCLVLGVSAAAGDNLLANGDFSKWTDGVPEGWTKSVGAHLADEGPESAVRPIEGGVSLASGPGTRVWHVLTQRVPVKPEGHYRLSFECRGLELRRDEGQFDESWVGVRLFMKGARGGLHTRTVRDGGWTTQQVLLNAAAADEAEITILSTKSGAMEVRRLVFEELTPADSFDVLASYMGRYYSYLQLKSVDWPKHTAAYRDRALAAGNAEAFADVARAMLAELKDGHVKVVTPGGRELVPWSREVRFNIDLRAVQRDLGAMEVLGKEELAGTMAGGYAYLGLGRLNYDDATHAKVLAAIEARLDSPGFLIDLRGNRGGAEVRAQEIVAIFADERRLYAKSLFRSGPAPADLSPGPERWVEPRKGKRFTSPVVCLIGPGCVSSGEGFAKMLKVLPHVTLVGQPTRGSSGNPMPVALPNGVVVHFSTWVDLMPDGTPVEDRGVAPQVVVEHEGAGDPTFRKALEILKEKCGK